MAGVAVYTKIEDNRYHHMMVALEDGAHVPTHQHTYPHTTYCREGRAKFWSEDGGERLLTAGDEWEVPAGIGHDIEFLTKGTVVECVHVLRFDDGREVPYDYQLTQREAVRMTGAL